MSLSPLQKEAILRNIKKIPIDTLKKKIDNNELTLEECIENGLSQTTVDEICFQAAAELEVKQFEEDATFYEKINNDELVIQEIKAAILDGRVTEEGLLNYTTIDENLLNNIKNISTEEQVDPEQIFSHSNDVTLRSRATDIYLLGNIAVGKTSILASIFLYGRRQGLLYSTEDVNFNKIVSLFENKIYYHGLTVPKINTIASDLHSEDKKIYPLNFIEMSGESFFISRKSDLWHDGVDADDCLSNSNKKLLFFVIDFEVHIEPDRMSSREAGLNLMLSKLDNYNKCLKNTYCIYIIVNKSDLFPADELLKYNNDRGQYARNFFTENYKSFYTNLKNKQDKYGFELRYLHYSLGNFMFRNSYLSEMNYDCPKHLIKTIQLQAGRMKSEGWFYRIFRRS